MIPAEVTTIKITKDTMGRIHLSMDLPLSDFNKALGAQTHYEGGIFADQAQSVTDAILLVIMGATNPKPQIFEPERFVMAVSHEEMEQIYADRKSVKVNI